MLNKRHEKTLESLKKAYVEADNNFAQIDGEFSRGSKEYRKAHQGWLEAIENLREFEDIPSLDQREVLKESFNPLFIAYLNEEQIFELFQARETFKNYSNAHSEFMEQAVNLGVI